MLWALARASVEVQEEDLSGIMVLIKELSRAVLVSDRRYVNLVQLLALKVREDCSRSGVNRRKAAKCVGKIEELNLKVQHLADSLQKVVRLQAQLTARDVQLTAVCLASSRSTRVLEELTQGHMSLQ